MAMKIILAVVLALSSVTASAATERFVVIFGGRNVGHLNAETTGSKTVIDYDVKNNGRGPTIAETIDLAGGLPVDWTITGATTFGSKVAERFSREGATATWTDSTGKGSSAAPGIYIGQSASPWALGVYARALLKAGGTMAALPGGTLRLDKGETVTVAGKPGPVAVTAYTIGGIDLQPDTVLLDKSGALFAEVSPDRVTVRAGYEGEEQRLRGLAAKWATDRDIAMQKAVAHRFAGPVRIRNVRVFDPKTSALTAPVSVVVSGHVIAAVEPVDSPVTPGETVIDGAGGTLVAGMTDMHSRLSQDEAMLQIAAGITTVRDMGNDNAVLARLIDDMDAGVIGGPRVVRSGFIEGKSAFSANNGIVVDSEAAAVAAVRWYGARGFWQIKIYNSMNPAWVPSIVAEAHKLGMRVAGHVPAFSNPDAMIKAGYDEMTHINQFMLGWVLTPTEDTRTLLRLTALKRFQALDLESARVQHTIQMMVDGHKAIDPTVGIHEQLTLDRDGQVPPGMVDYFDHMPIGFQRSAKKALSDTSAPGDDQAYRDAFDKIIATVALLHDRGIFIVPGTDTGGSFTYHRELELYQRGGMSPAEIVKLASYDTAAYLGQDQERGSITKGKLADFFLVPGDPTKDLKAIKRIAMVVKDGTVYFPSEIYPKFGIKPFVAAPKMVAAAN